MFRSTSFLGRTCAGIAAATLVAACGSGARNSAHHGGSRTATLNGVAMSIAQANHDMLRFAGCMRSHGVQGLPDPVSSPAAFKRSLTSTAPNFASAMTACGRLLPGQQNSDQGRPHTRAQTNAMLAFAHCMRAHGFSRFPDPTSNGSLTHEMLSRAGIDLRQPAAVRSADACVGVTHGIITRAMVTRFLAGQ